MARIRRAPETATSARMAAAGRRPRERLGRLLASSRWGPHRRPRAPACRPAPAPAPRRPPPSAARPEGLPPRKKGRCRPTSRPPPAAGAPSEAALGALAKRHPGEQLAREGPTARRGGEGEVVERPRGRRGAEETVSTDPPLNRGAPPPPSFAQRHPGLLPRRPPSYTDEKEFKMEARRAQLRAKEQHPLFPPPLLLRDRWGKSPPSLRAHFLLPRCATGSVPSLSANRQGLAGGVPVLAGDCGNTPAVWLSGSFSEIAADSAPSKRSEVFPLCNVAPPAMGHCCSPTLGSYPFKRALICSLDRPPKGCTARAARGTRREEEVSPGRKRGEVATWAPVPRFPPRNTFAYLLALVANAAFSHPFLLRSQVGAPLLVWEGAGA